MIAASATRRNTTVSGGNSFSTTPLKKNEPPHRTESRPSSDQSRASIEVSFAVMAAHICDRADLFRRAGFSHPISGQPLFRPRDDLDHPAFVFVGHLGFRAGIGLDRGTPEQRRVRQQGLGQFHRVGRILVAKR